MLLQNLKFGFKQFFSHFFVNFISLVFVGIFTLISFRTIVLIPVSLLLTQVVLIQIAEKGRIDFKAVVADLDFSFERYFAVLISSAIVIVIVLTGFSLFFIPGLIAVYTLQPYLYLLAKNSKLKANESLLLSYKIMKGNRFKLWSYDLVGLLVPILILITSLLLIRNFNLVDLTQLPIYQRDRFMTLPMFTPNFAWIGLIIVLSSLINSIWINIIYIAKIKFFASLIKKSTN